MNAPLRYVDAPMSDELVRFNAETLQRDRDRAVLLVLETQAAAHARAIVEHAQHYSKAIRDGQPGVAIEELRSIAKRMHDAECLAYRVSAALQPDDEPCPDCGTFHCRPECDEVGR